YDPATMGEWKVRLVSQRNYADNQPLTDWVDAENGEAEFSLSLQGLDSNSLRIVAEASLKSPIEGYQRIETSTVPYFVTVLRGGAIGAEVASRRISGEAPLMTTFKLDLFDREDQRALGDVIWETSSDQGGTWESYVPDPRYKLSRTQTFEKGTYWVRARMKNRNSGAESSTEIVEVIAYDKPELDVI